MNEIKASNPNLLEVEYSALRWNKPAQSYISPRGKFIDSLQVRKVIDADIVATQKRMQKLGSILSQAARDYQNGVTDKKTYDSKVLEFAEEMKLEVKNLHLANTMAAKGGIANMDKAAYGMAGQLLKFHYGKLNDFVQELQDNPSIATNDATGKMNFEDRIDLYGEAGRFTYETIRQKSHVAEGYKYEENVLEPGAKHCSDGKHSEGCLEQTAKGRVPIGTCVMIGKRTCGPKDQCHLKYYKYQKRQ